MYLVGTIQDDLGRIEIGTKMESAKEHVLVLDAWQTLKDCGKQVLKKLNIKLREGCGRCKTRY